jgi:hypothetical protein
MKKIITLLALLGCLSASASTKITVTVTFTGNPAVGNTITLNGEVRTFRAAVANSATDILRSAVAAANTATNYYSAITAAGYTYPGPPVVAYSSSTAVTITGVANMAMTATASGTWATITYATNTVAWSASSYAPDWGDSATDLAFKNAYNLYELRSAGIDTSSLTNLSVNTATNIAIGTVVAVPDGTGTNMLMFSSNPGGANNSGPAAVVVMVYDPATGTLNKWQGTSTTSTNINLSSLNGTAISTNNPVPVMFGTNTMTATVAGTLATYSDTLSNLLVTANANTLAISNILATIPTVKTPVGTNNAQQLGEWKLANGTNQVTQLGEWKVAQSTNLVGGFTVVCRGAITNDSNAGNYAVGDVYSAIFTCTNATRVVGGTGTLQSFKLFMGDNTNFNFEAFLFNAIPASLTQTNTVWSVSNADMQNYCVGYFNSTNYAWSSTGTNQIFTANNLGQPFVAAAADRNLYLALRINSIAPAGTNTTGVRLGFWQD